MATLIKSHRQLEVYQLARACADELFQASKRFPKEETYSLTDQVRRSSRSVNANLAEAWRKRRYPGAFVAKITECEGEAAETQTWIEFAVNCGYLARADGARLFASYERVLRMLVGMARRPEAWVLKTRAPDEHPPR